MKSDTPYKCQCYSACHFQLYMYLFIITRQHSKILTNHKMKFLYPICKRTNLKLQTPKFDNVSNIKNIASESRLELTISGNKATYYTSSLPA